MNTLTYIPDERHLRALRYLSLRGQDLGWEVQRVEKKIGRRHASKTTVSRVGAECPIDAADRLLYQALLNIAPAECLHLGGERAVGEWEIWRVPSQWVYGDGTRPPETYEVAVAPDGSARCTCPWASNGPPQDEPTPWGAEPSGATRPCAHSLAARLASAWRVAGDE